MSSGYVTLGAGCGEFVALSTGIHLALARELKRSTLHYRIAPAYIGVGQGIALLIENTSA